jgi:hypothetical protein
MLTLERLKETLEYNPETGHFIRIKPRSSVRVGDIAGYKCNGYISIEIDRNPYRAHRLAWFYTHGEWPAEHIDHINGDKMDNRLCNLREATRSQNMMNSKVQKSNTSGLKGAYKRGRGYVSTIRMGGEEVYLGFFKTPEEAHAAYCKAADEHHKEFARHG